uniref:AlNc14C312G10506 protein n=1 Tax=Albugo laibachii Nc14 TaxID=890382 RepID=F0WW62_9STRA|nr:AlNc14C312G10506 [Albugo laibachii Nc14]|eukprot:CCA25681.1 AlNc14C312G10506 [Albugo laibachii Nc14]
MGVKLIMTTAHRAQPDGQTERQNLVLEDALRYLVSYSGENWAKLLGTVEYAHVTSVNASTKLTPFEIDTGRKVSNLISHEYRDYDGLIHNQSQSSPPSSPKIAKT